MRPVFVSAALAAVLLLNACSAGAPRGAPAVSSEDRQMTNSPSSQHPTPAHSSASVTGIPIRVSFGDTTLPARLTNNPTALDLLSQLPLTLTFRDFNQVEKIADLPRSLSTAGAPPGADPDIRDIGYYSPSNNLVLYYGDVGYWNGIVRIGHFDTDIGSIEAQSGDFTVTIERTN